MFYASASELIAEIILKPHGCGPNCLCWELRALPAIEEEIEKLYLQKLEADLPTI